MLVLSVHVLVLSVQAMQFFAVINTAIVDVRPASAFFSLPSELASELVILSVRVLIFQRTGALAAVDAP